jgi:amino acid transporter
MVVPYYALDKNAPLAKMFNAVGLNWAPYVVSAGALCALTTSLLGGMFPLPRVILAMCRDGLLFKPLGYVHPRLKTALPATMIMGLLGAILALIFDVDALVNMMSIGTLLAYSLVSACAMLLRYRAEDVDFEEYPALESLFYEMPRNPAMAIFRPNSPRPTKFTANVVLFFTLFGAICAIALCAVLTFLPAKIFEDREVYAIVIFVVVLVLSFTCVGLVARQPQSRKPLFFRSPLMPLVPFLSIFCNIYLMFQLDSATWIRFGVWLVLGFIIYASYSWWHSEEERNPSAPSGHHGVADNSAPNYDYLPPPVYTVLDDPSYSSKGKLTITPVNGSKAVSVNPSAPPEMRNLATNHNGKTE